MSSTTALIGFILLMVIVLGAFYLAFFKLI